MKDEGVESELTREGQRVIRHFIPSNSAKRKGESEEEEIVLRQRNEITYRRRIFERVRIQCFDFDRKSTHFSSTFWPNE